MYMISLMCLIIDVKTINEINTLDLKVIYDHRINHDSMNMTMKMITVIDNNDLYFSIFKTFKLFLRIDNESSKSILDLARLVIKNLW